MTVIPYLFSLCLIYGSNFDFYILELFLNYARVIILLESIHHVKDTDDDCIHLYISNASQIIRHRESWS